MHRTTRAEESVGYAIDEFVRRHSRCLGHSNDNARDEAFVRNRILVAQHGRIPSFALYRPCDIDRDDEYSRLEWWSSFGVDVRGDTAALGLERLHRFLLQAEDTVDGQYAATAGNACPE